MTLLSRFASSLLLGGCFLTAVVGCGDGQGSLSGAVTLDGQPLPEGQIAIEPKDGQGTPAGGLVKDGKYTIMGDVPPGEYVVRINASKVVGRVPAYGNDTNGPMKDITEPIIPAKYNVNTTLNVTLKAGANTQDFATTSQ